MARIRARAAVLTGAVACAAILIAHGQTSSPLAIVPGLGLPAVEESFALTYTPGASPLRDALQRERAGGDTGYVPGRLIVRFRDQSSTIEREAAIRHALGEPSAFIAQRPEHANFDLVRIDAADDAEVAAETLGYEPSVEYAQAAYRLRPTFVPNDPQYATLQWNLPLLNLEQAWDIQPSAGSSIVVAILDTGLAYTNATVTATIPAFTNRGVAYPALGRVTIPYSAAPQLVGNGNASRIVAPHDFIWNTAVPLDFDGHGTHVAGTIGQLTNDSAGTAGVAFNVRLMPVKVLDEVWDDLFGSPNQATDDVVAQGIRYAADNGANIINMSLGRTSPATCGTNRNQPGCAPAIEDAITYAVSKGVFFAISAGNEGLDSSHPTSTPAEIANRVQGAVSVAAIDATSGHAYYSSQGPWVELAAPGGSDAQPGGGKLIYQQTFDFRVVQTFNPSIVAPSNYTAPRFDVLTTVGYEGTSMAAPHVAGIAAMMMQQGVTSPAAIEALLEKYAVDLGASGRDDLFGFGLIDARAVLRGMGLNR
ncbi:MAG TPA: S8 family serine peptidase [Vicinamibacterales bacterium]|jgi:serine protease